MKKFIRILSMCLLIFMVFSVSVQATSSDFWGQASSWFGKTQSVDKNKIDEIEGVENILDSFLSMLNILGTTVIVSVTIILGIKFMFGSVEGQTSAKQGLVTLLVACVFFFGFNSLKNLLYPNGQLIFFSSSDRTIEAPVGRAFAYVKFFGNIFAFIAIVWVGVKYIFSGVDGRADLKKQSVQFIIGLIMTFATVNFLSLISDAVNQALR